MNSWFEKEEAIEEVKSFFSQQLMQQLCLKKVSAPLAVLQGTGVNDDLNGTQNPATFSIKDFQGRQAEIVHSLAKWKRLRLGSYGISPGLGILADMKAIRADEVVGPLHSIYVDQWDWEKRIDPADRQLSFLKQEVEKVYSAICKTESMVALDYDLPPTLPSRVKFLHAEELLQKYPFCSPKEREDKAAKEFGAIFIIGIGAVLANGQPHDGRAPDYDDWSTPTSAKTRGLNGDLILWYPVLERSIEISSMGVRVSAKSLERQLGISKKEYLRDLYFHRELLAGRLPECIGGGIGQSRLCMFLLRKKHIGQVQVGLWSEDVRADCEAAGVDLL